ncbi:hypothetical protein EUTSA_v10006653mg [Eutrema salsugineum]|uniref:Valine--tRNA ligase, mitochondrial n=1 Tax=Eutrema salsugineum TaxID=72664 RepID=V4KWE2_EUTSA|nr:valine--tRNA ligase, mitochondrial 1 [Eutrema salsugineum]ESQ34362.1 hypothetical protein EUTSA_v10006653mg [Eutrema salsugineum]
MSEAEKKKIATEMERKLKNEEKAREKEMRRQKALEKAKLGEIKAAKPKTLSEKKTGKEGDDSADFVDPETPLGERKRLSSQMAKQYNPSSVEKSWYEWWEKSEFFKADAKSSKPKFVMILPPPNVTGALHIGHELTCAIEDTLVRWKRMSGFETLWVPGFDHAGIATQGVVEKELKHKTGLTRNDLGREDFLKQVWKWTHQYSGKIQAQLRRLGSSLDWSRECFTMDEQRSKAVTEAFVRLHKEGLIYRRDRIVHWDCFSGTALSDCEVEHIDIKGRTPRKVPGYDKQLDFGVMTSFAYPLERGGGKVVVATTRVETMLGDTAIAVHPDDERYKHLHGEFAVHPFSGRKLPIICDEELVDPELGTGCVKITPSHDPKDFEVGKRHNLEFINIFTDDGRINTNGGQFTGMARFDAREAVIEALRVKGLYIGTEDKEMVIGVCSRSGDIVEPMIKPQWYVDCSVMAKEALDVAANGKLDFFPKKYSKEWRRWLEDIRDWCISRQIWWGHRVPAWYATLEEDELKEAGAYTDHWIVARDEEEARKEAASKFSGKKLLDLSQDPDVLDTWFSSGLFPLSVFGWPDETEDFKSFYPVSVLETGLDILFFWVVRMVMLGMKLGDEDVPFSKVYLHPMVRDAHGRKMSKSLGNGIDPLEVINGETLVGLHTRLEKGNLDPKELLKAKEGQVKDFPNGIPECGADALRFALISYTDQSYNVNMDVLRVVGYRQWCNKLWNAVRFAMMKLGDDYTPPPLQTLSLETMLFSCQWILSVLNNAVSKTVDSLNAFEFSDAASTVYSWWQYQFCDVFVEAIKPCFSADNPGRTHAQDALWVCLETGLRLLHPFMPFITEELWQRLPSPKDCERKASIMICDYPSPIEKWTNEKVETEMDMVLATVKTFRALRAAGSLERQRNERLNAFALCGNASTLGIMQSHELEMRTLANLSSFEVVLKGEEDKAGEAGSAVVETVNESLKVYLKVDGAAFDLVAELEKIRSKVEEIEKQKNKLQKLMSVSGYEEKVPAHIKEDNARKLAKLLQELEFFNEN